MEHVLRIPQTSNTEFSATLSVGILILLPLLTSIYPFIRYNYVSPSVSIRSVNAGGHSIVSRVLFLFVQYIITFVLIIVSLFFTKQVRFMLSADLNYTTKDIIQCQLYAERSSYDINISDEEWERRKQREKSNLAYIKEEMDHSRSLSVGNMERTRISWMTIISMCGMHSGTSSSKLFTAA